MTVGFARRLLTGFFDVLLSHQEASGTAGGSRTLGSWATELITNELYDPQNLCSIASNRFTLAGGSWQVGAFVLGNNVSSFQSRIQNVTQATTSALGLSMYSGGPSPVPTPAVVLGAFDCLATDQHELQTKVSASVSTFGGGVPTSFGTEIYHFIALKKVK